MGRTGGLAGTTYHAWGLADAVWSVIDHPGDGRAALVVPAMPEDVGLDLSRAAYDALLTAEESTALVKALPEDWVAGELWLTRIDAADRGCSCHRICHIGLSGVAQTVEVAGAARED